MTNIKSNTPKEMHAVIDAVQGGKRIRITGKADASSKIFDAKHINFNFRDCRYDIIREPRSYWKNEYESGLSHIEHTTEAAAVRCGNRTATGYVGAVEFREVLK